MLRQGLSGYFCDAELQEASLILSQSRSDGFDRISPQNALWRLEQTPELEASHQADFALDRVTDRELKRLN